MFPNVQKISSEDIQSQFESQKLKPKVLHDKPYRPKQEVVESKCLVDTESQKVLERKKRFDQGNVTLQKSDYMPVNPLLLEIKDKKSHNRIGFRFRTSRLVLPKQPLRNPPKNISQVSPWLDEQQMPNISIGERLLGYSKNHRCPHNKKFNRLEQQGRFFVVSCDHEFEKICEKVAFRCIRCGAPETFVINRPCKCSAYACGVCHNQFYKHSDGVYRNYDFHCHQMIEIIHENKEQQIAKRAIAANPFVAPPKLRSSRRDFMKSLKYTPRVVNQKTFASMVKSETIDEVISKVSEAVIAEKQGAIIGKVTGTVVALTDTFAKSCLDILGECLRYFEAVGEKVATFVGKIVGVEHVKRFCDFLTAMIKFALSVILFEGGAMIQVAAALYDLFKSDSMIRKMLALQILFQNAIRLGAQVKREYTTIEHIVATRTMTVKQVSDISPTFGYLLEFYESGVNVTKAALNSAYETAASLFTWKKKVKKTSAPFKVKIDPDFDPLEFSDDDVKEELEYFRVPKEQLGIVCAARIKDLEATKQEYWLDPDYLQCVKFAVDMGLGELSILAKKECGKLTDFPSLLCSYLPMFKMEKYGKALREFAVTILPVVSMTSGITNIARNLWQAMKTVYTYLFGMASPKEWLKQKMATTGNPINAYIVYCLEIKRAAILTPPPSTMLDALRKLQIEAMNFVAESGMESTETMSFFSNCDKFLSLEYSMEPREDEPLIIQLSGLPGAGKSTIWPVIIARILGCTVKEAIDKTYVRNINSQFWDGCRGKEVVLYDDLGQSTEEKDFCELISLGTKSTFLPDMSRNTGPESKGLTFAPKLIVCCSNARRFTPRTISDSDALMRRFNVFGEVVRGENGIVDTEINATSHYFAHANGLTVTEFADYCNANYKKKLTMGKKTDDLLEDMLRTPECNKFVELKKPDLSTTIVPLVTRSTKVGSVLCEKHSSVWSVVLRNVVYGLKSEIGAATYLATLLATALFARHQIEVAEERTFWTYLKATTLAIAPVLVYCGIMQLYRATPIESEVQSVSKKPVDRKVVISTPQSAIDIVELVKKNSMLITNSLTNEAVNATFVRGNYILAPEHIFLSSRENEIYAPDGTEFVINRPTFNTVQRFKFVLADLKKLGKDVDMVVYKLPLTFNAGKDIVERFWDGAQTVKHMPVYFYDHYANQLLSRATVIDDQLVAHYDAFNVVYDHTVLACNYPCIRGSCGGLTICANNSLTDSPIMSMHVAKVIGDDRALSLIVTRKMLEKVLPSKEGLEPPLLTGIHTRVIGEVQASFPINGSAEQIGELRHRLHENTKSKLEPSLVCGILQEPTTGPAILSKYDPRIPEGVDFDPLVEGVKKLEHTPLEFPKKDVEEIFEAMREFYAGLKFQGPNKVLNTFHAINGIRNLDGFKSLDFTTSAGFPFTMDHKTKEDLFEFRDTFYYPKQILIDQINYDLDLLERGICPDWLNVLSCKDERVKLKKIYEKPKTRVFAVAAISSTIIMRKFLLSFCARLAQNNAEVPFAIGMDRLGLDWHTYVSKLAEAGDHGFDGDYEQYDRTQSKGLLIACGKLCEKLLRNGKELPIESDPYMARDYDYNKIATSLWEAIATPVYAFQNYIFRKAGTVSSGLFVTALFNSLNGEFYHRFCFQKLVPAPHNNQITFNKCVRIKVLGDDNVAVTSTPFLKYYNAVTMSRVLSEYGLTYTSVDKGVPVPTRPLADLSFLKNKTGMRKGLYVPLMDMGALIEMSNWIRISKFQTRHEATENNCNAMLRGLYYYGPIVYNNYRDQLMKALPNLHLYCYKELDAIILQYGYFPETSYVSSDGGDLMTGLIHTNKVHSDPKVCELQNRIMSERQSGNYTPPRIHCDTCNVKNMTTQEAMDHYASAAHSVKSTLRNKSIVTDIEESFEKLSVGNVESKGEIVDGKFIGHCYICSLNFTSRNRFYGHMNNQHSSLDETVDFNHIDFKEYASDAPLIYLRKWYTELQMFITNGEVQNISPFVKAIVDEGKQRELYHFINGLICSENRIFKKVQCLKQSGNAAGIAKAETMSDVPNIPEPEATHVTAEAVSVVEDPYNAESQMTTRVGVTTDESNKPFKMTPNRAGKVSYDNQRAELSLGDISWNLEKMLSRFNQVETLKWKLTDAPGVNIAVYDVVTDLLKNAISAQPFMLFQEWACKKVLLRIICTASKWHQGRIVCGFYPTCVQKANAVVPSTENMSVVGWAQIDPAVGSVIDFEIPFVHWKGFLNLIYKDSLGQFYIRVLNQLQAVAGASTEVEIRLMMSIEGSEFKIPRADSTTFKGLVAQRQSGMGARIPLDDENEGIPLAPARAMTKDPKVKHFGEYYTTWRDENKRYKLILQQTLSVGDVAAVTFQVRQMQDALAYSSKCFFLNRCPYNFKVRITPRGQLIRTQPALRCKVFLTNDFLDYAYPDDVVTDRGPLPIHNFSEMEDAEFSIPYLNQTSTCLNSWAVDDVHTELLNAQDSRILTFIFTSDYPDNKEFEMTIYGAFADEAAFGLFAGYPSLEYAKYPTDGWTLLKGKKTVYPAKVALERVTVDTQKVEAEKQSGAINLDKTLNTVIEKLIPDDILVDALGACLDKVVISLPPEPVKMRRMEYFNHASGVSYIDNLILYPDARQKIDKEHFGVDRDEMNYMLMVKQRKSFLGTYTWKATANSKDLIASFKVGPMFELPVQAESGTIYKSSLLTYVSAWKESYRGGVTFTFEIVASQFHEGKIDICYHPNTGIIPPYDAAVTQYLTSFTLRNGHNTVVVTCPFLSETPWKRVYNGFPLSEETEPTGRRAFKDYFLGSLSLYVSSPLRAPTTVVPQVEINVYVQAAKDFEVNGVTSKNASLIPK